MKGERDFHIGVIGGGISGIAAAYLLSKKYNVTILESHSRIGGHTNTIEVEDNFKNKIPIDTGFIVLNDCNYGVLHNLFCQWKVDVRWSDMSFSFYNPKKDYFYAGTDVFSLFPSINLIYSKNHLSLIYDIVRFGKIGLNYLKSQDKEESYSLEDFLRETNFNSNFIENYLLPMGSAIWSMPPTQILYFPAYSFLSFFKNHGLLSVINRPRWQTVVGGSYAYVEKFKKIFSGAIYENFKVAKVIRTKENISVHSQDGEIKEFDEVVFACHADTVLSLIENPSESEVEIFSKWKYQGNTAILHTDNSVMPPKKQCWASWNSYHTETSKSATLTYYMNKLQGITSNQDYFVTLNDEENVSQDKIIKKINYTHPIYNPDSLSTQRKLHIIQGQNRTYFCGSYFGYGFHEDGARSGAQVGLYKGICI